MGEPGHGVPPAVPQSVPEAPAPPPPTDGAAIFTAADEQSVHDQLGRVPRGVVRVGWRCPCGRPGVVVTSPRLPDGTPFPTIYYLTCPRATSACSTLEANGVMAQMQARLATDDELAAGYRAAHEAYLADRRALGDVPELKDMSAGGMPTRVKCLHALVAHALAAGAGVNPLGDEALGLVGTFWERPCGCGEGPADAVSPASQVVGDASSRQA